MMTGSAVELMEQQLMERVMGDSAGQGGGMRLSPRWLAVLAEHGQPQRSSSSLFTPAHTAPVPARHLPARRSVAGSRTDIKGACKTPASKADEQARPSSSVGSAAYSPALGIDFYVSRTGVVRVKAITPGAAAEKDGR